MINLSTVRSVRIRQGSLPGCSVLAFVFLTSSLPAVLARASSLTHEAGTQALILAEGTPWNQPRHSSGTTHPLGVQTLSIEREENKHDPDPRRLRVYQFNYQLEQARVLSLDVSDNQVLHNQPVRSVHLPLSDKEIAFASQLLNAQEDIMSQLRDEQISRGRIAFTNLSQLDVKASIFEPLEITHPCHRQRCALMSLFDDTHTVFSVEPVINLQTLQVSVLQR